MDISVLNKISGEQAWHYRILPQEITDNKLVLFIDENVPYQEIENELKMVLDTSILLIPKPASLITKGLSEFYRVADDRSSKILNTTKPEEILDNLLHEAHSLLSSDIHLEPAENYCMIRYRMDGKLKEKYKIEKSVYLVLLNKLKITSKLDISEKRLPQDGRMNINTNENQFDIRVSTLPTLFGEKAVLRILKKDASHLSLENIGITESQLKIFRRGIAQNQGLILISGPTGSGKTTTLYATMKELNTSSKNILTIEDPIEYTLTGLNQVQLRENIGLTYPKALKAFLRQDPDIIMIGEIRDPETASMALRASLTGHLVLATIHTNSSWETIERLEDLNVPRFSIASTLILSVAQRLLRKLCENCKTLTRTSKLINHELIEEVDFPEEVYQPIGCPACHYTGYSGRIAIYELLQVNSQIRKSIKNRDDEDSVFQHSKIEPLKSQAKRLVLSGVTSIEEALPLVLSA